MIEDNFQVDEPARNVPEGGAATKPGAPRTLLSRFALLAAADIFCRLTRFLADVALGRHFGRAVFGQLNLAQSLAVQGMSVAGGGLDTFGMREAAAGRMPAGPLAATIVLLRAALGIVVWAIVAAVTWLVPQYRESFVLAALYGLSIFTGALTVGWLAQALGRMNVVALSLVSTHIVYFGGVQIAVQQAWPAASVPVILVGAETLTAAGLWLWLVRRFGALPRPLPLRAALQILRESLPIGGANIVRALTTGSDILLLGLFVSEAAVGIYGAGFKLYSLGAAIIALYLSVLLPHLAASRLESKSPADRGDDRARDFLRTAMQRALAPALLAAAVVVPAAWLAAGLALRLLFGPDFEGGAETLRILLLALPLTLVAGHFRSALVVLGRQRLDLGLAAFGAGVHVAAKVVLIFVAGPIGCAAGTIAGEAALALCACVAYYRQAA